MRCILKVFRFKLVAMKAILLFSLMISAAAQAATTFQFLPLNMNALVIVRGSGDNDFSDLYKLLNVPEQDTTLGKGKGLKTEDKGFNMACSLDKAMCQVVLNKGPQVVIDPAKKYMSYRVEGEAARALADLFVKNSADELHFITSDRLFRLHYADGIFVFEASQKGFNN
jgi:hypothetical protein